MYHSCVEPAHAACFGDLSERGLAVQVRMELVAKDRSAVAGAAAGRSATVGFTFAQLQSSVILTSHSCLVAFSAALLSALFAEANSTGGHAAGTGAAERTPRSTTGRAAAAQHSPAGSHTEHGSVFEGSSDEQAAESEDAQADGAAGVIAQPLQLDVRAHIVALQVCCVSCAICRAIS